LIGDVHIVPNDALHTRNNDRSNLAQSGIVTTQLLVCMRPVAGDDCLCNCLAVIFARFRLGVGIRPRRSDTVCRWTTQAYLPNKIQIRPTV